jgi:hypothetical protein
MAEYAVVLAGIAVLCLLAIMFLAAGIRGRFESTNTPTPAGPFEPPSTGDLPQLTYPTTIAECEHGGWRNFAQFRNEAECTQYVDSLKP